MGLPIRELNVTNTGDETGRILLTEWIPDKHADGKYYWPPHTPLGYHMWIPNVLGLKIEEGTVPVEIVESEKETGLWLICVNDYFGDEQHLYANNKPIHKEEKDRFGDYKGFRDWIIDEDEEYNSLHVDTDIKMKAGIEPISVTLKRKKKCLLSTISIYLRQVIMAIQYHWTLSQNKCVNL